MILYNNDDNNKISIDIVTLDIATGIPSCVKGPSFVRLDMHTIVSHSSNNKVLSEKKPHKISRQRFNFSFFLYMFLILYIFYIPTVH